MDGLLVLRVLELSEAVLVGLPLEKLVADSLVAVVGSVVQCSPLPHVLSVDVSSRGEEQVHALGVASLAREMERCAFLFIDPLDLGTVSQKKLDQSFVIVQSSEVERRPRLVRVSVHLSAAIADQDGSALKISVVGGMMKSSPAI